LDKDDPAAARHTRQEKPGDKEGPRAIIPPA
jgi:hypothetical protein